MIHYIDEETKRMPFFRAIAVFFLTIFGILALGTEVVDVVNGYSSLSITAPIGLGIVALTIFWLISFLEGLPKKEKDEKIDFGVLGIFLLFPCAFTTFFYLAHYPLQDITPIPRLQLTYDVASIFIVTLIVIAEAAYSAAKDYQNVTSSKETTEEVKEIETPMAM